MALPAYQGHVVRSQIAEALQLAKPIQTAISEIYQQQRRFPLHDDNAGVPQSQFLIGNYVTNITVDAGQFISP